MFIIDIFNKSVLHMKPTLILFVLLLTAYAHIYSAPSKVTYNYNARPLYYSLYMSLQRGIGASDYLKLIFNQALYSSTKNEVVVNLISFSNNLVVATTTCALDGIATSTILHVNLGYAMSPNTWYEVQIYPSTLATLSSGNFLVQVFAVSSFDPECIIYDSNLAFGYINVLTSSATTTLGIVGNSSSSQATVPAAIYSYDIYVTPTITNGAGGNFTLQIYYNSGDGTQSVTGTSLIDFTFMGLCQSAATQLSAAAVLNYCSISSDLSTITFSVNSITAGQAIRISTSISNPSYYSIRGIKGFYTQFVSGKVVQNGLVNNCLQVARINIDAANPRVQLFWGIDSTTSIDSGILNLPLFKAASVTPNILQYNSFNIGFQFSATSPITGLYKVQITIGAQGVLQASIAHNFPAYSGTTVYCYYSSPKITCNNVGAFINTSFRYFISGKAFFANGAGTSVVFGGITIIPIVYDTNGILISTPQLYNTLAGITMTLQPSQQLLDATGYHSTSSFQIGNTQVVSYADDLTLSSTANAIQGFLQGTNSTVGIVPGLGTSQQLLFLLKTPSSVMFNGGNPSKAFTIQLMYNNKVISFQSSASGRGLDFVGYSTTLVAWSITASPCYANAIVCQKYNNFTVATNTNTLVNTGATSNFWGMYNFKCGQNVVNPPSCSGGGTCSTECNMFTGYSLGASGASIMSMRQVVFPSGYQTPIYADSNLLDFLFVFSQGTSIISYSLINGYTLTGADMQNIKAAYVNYFDNTFNSVTFNKGSRVPMMIRIGGGVLPAESIAATAIGIYFDDYVDASTFYTTKGSSWALGCSTGTCSYFPNNGLFNSKMDSWLTSRSIQVYNLPPIQNQFNILIPVTPDPTNHQFSPPRILTIVFFSQNYTIGTISGLLNTLSVYRLFGPTTTGSVTGAIPTVNSLARNGGGSTATPTAQMIPDNFASSGAFSVSLNTTNMYSSSTNNTFTFGNTATTAFGTTFGAGYTITSFYYNIFASSTLQWNQPPSNTATTCTTFGYVYNQILLNTANAYKDKQWFYLAFCPIDATLNLHSSAANIDFLNPQYPTFLTSGFNLRSLLTYAYSDQTGYLRAYNRQQNPILTTFVRSCTTAKLQTYNPSSTGKQRSTFTLTTPAITMGTSTAFNGYKTFMVRFTIPSTTYSGSNLIFSTSCDTSIASVSCSCTNTLPNITVTITYLGASTITITYMQINLYATASLTFGTAAAYVVTLFLPQQYSVNNDIVPFGDSYGSQATYCYCSSSFTVGITGYGTTMNLNTLAVNSASISARSKISFIFGASSYRDAFFSSSKWKFNFGCLTNPNSATYFTLRKNFRCMIYQGSNATSMSLSSSWSTISFTSFASVTVSPKAQISNPSSIIYSMVCFGGAAPDGSNQNPVTGFWDDAGAVVQTASGVAYSTLGLSAMTGNTSTIVITKRFATSGFKSFYTFEITCSASLTSNAVFYLDFYVALNSFLDNEGVVQCYLRTSAGTTDAQASYTYCSFVNPWQLMVWSNQALNPPNSLFIDVFNIDQPKTDDVSNTGQSKISLTVDDDGLYSNGVISYIQATDSQPPASTASNIIIKTVTADNSFILSTQTLTITIDTQAPSLFNSANTIYVLFPASYAQWITRGQSLSVTDETLIYCQFKGSGANLATACAFISQRILKISVAIAAGQTLFTLKLKNIMTPASVPIGKFNQYRFKIFVSNALQTAITYYSFTDYSQHLSLTTNPSLISLSWNYYSLSVSDTLFSLSSLTNQVITIQQGYYSNLIELRQSIYPQNFYATIALTLTGGYAANYFYFLGGSLTTVLGKPLTYFRIAGGIAPAGLYTLKFTKTGDTNSQYTNIPPLTLVVKNTKCALTTDSSTYTLPIGGSTLPIIINGINCIPTSPITISFAYSVSGNGQFSVNTDLSSLTFSSTSFDGQIYIIFKHTKNTLTAGGSVVVTFTIGGTNSAYYSIIPTITLTLVDPTTFQTYPTATALGSPTLSANSATLQLQCSQASLIFWGIGVYPSILNYQAVDFQARIISGGNGLQTNFTQSNDYFQKVYGIRQGTTMQVISKTLYNLQSNVNYLFKYFCMNQLGHISDSQSISFTSANYGAYLMKVQVTFRGSINYLQYNQLACSMAQNFVIPYNRVYTQAMSYCGSTPYTFYATDTSVILNQPDSNGWYIYGFYIEPDYTLASDSTNTNIRNLLSISTSATTVITSTTNYISLPSLVQMQTYDIQIYTVPIMAISAPISGLTSIVISASITNMNGFIIVGVMNQTFDPSIMTIPSVTNIKQGIFSTNVSLNSVQMIHSTQNYNTTFQITGLNSNTLYTIFYFCTVEDPAITSLSSSVQYTTAQTLQMLTININWAPQLVIFILPVLALFLL